jgi:hypothetical protein
VADAQAMAAVSGGSLNIVAFGVAADLVYNIFSATNSSPQTTELFAGDRADTLWKYVKLGAVQSAVLVGVMVVGGGPSGAWALAGGLLSAGFMWAMYRHALVAGMNGAAAENVT